MLKEAALGLIAPRSAAQIAATLDKDVRDPQWVQVRERAMLLSAELGIPSRISDELLARCADVDNQLVAGYIEARCRNRAEDPEWIQIRDIVECIYGKACLESQMDPVRTAHFHAGLSEVLGVSPAVAFYALMPTVDGRITMTHDRVVSRGGHAAKVELAGGRCFAVAGQDAAEGWIRQVVFTPSEEEAIEEMEIHMAEIGCRNIGEVFAVPLAQEPAPQALAQGKTKNA